MPLLPSLQWLLPIYLLAVHSQSEAGPTDDVFTTSELFRQVGEETMGWGGGRGMCGSKDSYSARKEGGPWGQEGRGVLGSAWWVWPFLTLKRRPAVVSEAEAAVFVRAGGAV